MFGTLNSKLNDYIVLREFDLPSADYKLGSNTFDITLSGYKPIGVAYAMMVVNDAVIRGTRLLYTNNKDQLDIRLTNACTSICRYGIIYKKVD